MIGLTASQIIGIHDDMIRVFGGSFGYSQAGKKTIEYAASAPFMSMCGDDLYPTIEAKAAILMKTIVKDHPFIDGNKRTGLMACLAFLELNGYKIDYDEQEAIDLTLELAKGEIDQEDVTDWIEKEIKKKKAG